MSETYRIVRIDLCAPIGVRSLKVIQRKLDHAGAIEAIRALRAKRLPGSRWVEAVQPEKEQTP